MEKRWENEGRKETFLLLSDLEREVRLEENEGCVPSPTLRGRQQSGGRETEEKEVPSYRCNQGGKEAIIRFLSLPPQPLR